MKYLKFGLKVVAILAVISVGYYFGYLKPYQAKVREASIHYSNLIQNRTAYINLAKLDPDDPSFDIQKSNLIDIIKETNTKGLKEPLNDTEKQVFEKQNNLLERVFATKSYEDGVEILKSDESIKLLKDMSGLLAELQRVVSVKVLPGELPRKEG